MEEKTSKYIAFEIFMRIPFPEGNYIKKIEINNNDIEVEFSPRKKIALLFISINDRYWPYLSQIIKDCRKNFLPQHRIDYFVWTDFNKGGKETQLRGLESYFKNYKESLVEKKQETLNVFLNLFMQIVRLYELFYLPFVQESIKRLSDHGLVFKRDGPKFWVESPAPLTEDNISLIYEEAKKILIYSQMDVADALRDTFVSETEPIEWPHPTLMRYHLFLQQEEKLKDYDYIFYMDADMRVVTKISDEILGEGLTATEHPMYALSKEYIPPYEPNSDSTAYIKRPGRVIDDNGRPRFKPYYYGGGFQGGTVKEYLEAMKILRKNIDKDFDKNYVAIWNDESHWNKFLSDYTGDLTVLSPSYIYPDSLIKEYYEKIWGCSYEPKIITLTKPFTLSMQGAEEINKFIQQ